MNNRIIAKLFMIIVQFIFYFLVNKILGIPDRILYSSFGVYLILNFTKNAYSFKTTLIWDELKAQLRIHTEYFFIMIVMDIMIYDILKSISLSKIMLLHTGIAVIFTFYNLFMMIFTRKIFKGILIKKLLIVGCGRTALHLTEVIKNNPFTMYEVSKYVCLSMKSINENLPKEKMISQEEMGNYLEKNKIDEVIIALPNLETDKTKCIVDSIGERVNKIKIIPQLNTTFTFNSKVEDYDGMMLISNTIKSSNRFTSLLKRIIDIFAGIMGILILGPLTTFIWKKTDKKERKEGLFFNQPRIGLNGKSITIYKYRSMITGADEILERLMKEDPKIKEEYETNKKLKNDPRITEIGKKLRKTSLDEFPQFVNVLKGEMSLIGPRPYLHREIKDMKSSYDKIIKTKPGISGMWQTHGRSDTTFEERLELDEYYFRNWSLWLDIVLILKTVLQTLRRKGAY